MPNPVRCSTSRSAVRASPPPWCRSRSTSGLPDRPAPAPHLPRHVSRPRPGHRHGAHTEVPFMVPGDLRYTKEHEWVRIDGDEAVVGITQFAADQLGDIVFVELPAVGKALDAHATFGVVESV